MGFLQVLVTAVLATLVPNVTALLAFPGAEGFGRNAVGGRTGSVYHVTNLAYVSNLIKDFKSSQLTYVVIRGPDLCEMPFLWLTVLWSSMLEGQSTLRTVSYFLRISMLLDRLLQEVWVFLEEWKIPGPSFQSLCYSVLTSSRESQSMAMGFRGPMQTMPSLDTFGFVWAKEVILAKVILGCQIFGTWKLNLPDGITIADGNNMIFDHLSVTWGRDETFSINGAVTNVTIQNSIIGQGLETHSCGGLMQSDHGISLFRNLYIDNKTRNPKVKGMNDFQNNVSAWTRRKSITATDIYPRSYTTGVVVVDTLLETAMARAMPTSSITTLSQDPVLALQLLHEEMQTSTAVSPYSQVNSEIFIDQHSRLQQLLRQQPRRSPKRRRPLRENLLLQWYGYS